MQTDYAPYTNGLNRVHAPDASRSYQERLEAFRRSDAERDALVQDLFRGYQELQNKYQQKCDDYVNEVESRRIWYNKATQADQLAQSLQRSSDTSPFVLVLIDGDGALFQDALYRAGGDGGADAAHRLREEVQRHIEGVFPQANTSSWNVVVNIFCNFEGLAAKLRAVGILKYADINNFARAFGLNQPLFNMIDVGTGKERADYKLREHFRLYLPIPQCKHIVLGGIGHDFGYLPMLDPYKRDPASTLRISLLETYSAHDSFRQLGFPILQFPDVFRAHVLPDRAEASMPHRTMSTQSVTMSPSAPVYSMPVAHAANGNGGVVLPPPTTTSSTPVSDPNSWATVGKKNAEGAKTINVASKKQPAPKFLVFNRYDERIDQDLPRFDQSAMNRLYERINNKKVCNIYHLTGKCDKEGYCDYDHGERLSPGEQLALKHQARKRCCNERSSCFDFDCQQGHTCLFGKSCNNGEKCWFKDVHHVDKTPSYRYYENGRKENVSF